MTRTSAKAMQKMSRAQLEGEIKRLEFTVTSRGRRMGSMYHTIKHLIRDHPDTVHVHGMNNQEKDMIQHLQNQLTQSRSLMTQMMQNKPAASASDGDHVFKGDCVVCFETFNGTEHKPVALNCGHILCEGCVLKYQEFKDKPSCPQCRKPFQSFIPLFI